MATTSLALKYRPQSWDDLTEQESIKIILTQQLETGTFQHCYLFTGPAGCGKTTSARIFANNINKGKGNPIELDAASNNSVEDVRSIIQQAKTFSMESEYKVFIIDECHAISSAGWQAFLKIIEEPPTKSIFIFCTTDPQKIPNTILSRVQRYDFQKISYAGIVSRLLYILDKEHIDTYEKEAIEFIAKLSSGGMRNALTTLDKCLAYSSTLSTENVSNALGTTNYDDMFILLENIANNKQQDVIKCLNSINNSGKDLKVYVKQFTAFLLDICKYSITNSFEFINIPPTYTNELNNLIKFDFLSLLDTLIRLNSDLKWDTQPQVLIESSLLINMYERTQL